jgi:hypothetical protein
LTPRGGGSAARAGNEEHRLLTLDDRFGGHRFAQQGLVLLEGLDELLPVLDLKRSICHFGFSKSNVELRHSLGDA